MCLPLSQTIWTSYCTWLIDIWQPEGLCEVIDIDNNVSDIESGISDSYLSNLYFLLKMSSYNVSSMFDSIIHGTEETNSWTIVSGNGVICRHAFSRSWQTRHKWNVEQSRSPGSWEDLPRLIMICGTSSCTIVQTITTILENLLPGGLRTTHPFDTCIGRCLWDGSQPLLCCIVCIRTTESEAALTGNIPPFTHTHLIYAGSLEVGIVRTTKVHFHRFIKVRGSSTKAWTRKSSRLCHRIPTRRIPNLSLGLKK